MINSNFTKFAIPIKIPRFKDVVLGQTPIKKQKIGVLMVKFVHIIDFVILAPLL